MYLLLIKSFTARLFFHLLIQIFALFFICSKYVAKLFADSRKHTFHKLHCALWRWCIAGQRVPKCKCEWSWHKLRRFNTHILCVLYGSSHHIMDKYDVCDTLYVTEVWLSGRLVWLSDKQVESASQSYLLPTGAGKMYFMFIGFKTTHTHYARLWSYRLWTST